MLSTLSRIRWLRVKSGTTDSRHGQMKLDEFDLKILEALQRNGRMTKVQLAREINLSPSPCWERVRQLEASGLIRGYHAEIDIDRLMNLSMVLVEVTLKSHRAEDFERFEEVIRTIPEVMECYATGGGFDYLLKVVAPNIDYYQHLIEGLLDADIGIDRYYTYFVTKSIKLPGGYPIRHLLDSGRIGIAKRK